MLLNRDDMVFVASLLQFAWENGGMRNPNQGRYALIFQERLANQGTAMPAEPQKTASETKPEGQPKA